MLVDANRKQDRLGAPSKRSLYVAAIEAVTFDNFDLLPRVVG